MNRKKSAVALTIALACLFSIISARMTIRRIATPENCVIHDLPEGMPVILNTSNGTVGELIPDPRAYSTKLGDTVTASYYEYECQYPDFTIISNSGSHNVDILIPKNSMEEYDHRLAIQYICEDCLRNIEQIIPTGNLLILVKNSEGLYLKWLNDMTKKFAIMSYSFTTTKMEPPNAAAIQYNVPRLFHSTTICDRRKEMQ